MIPVLFTEVPWIITIDLEIKYRFVIKNRSKGQNFLWYMYFGNAIIIVILSFRKRGFFTHAKEKIQTPESSGSGTGCHSGSSPVLCSCRGSFQTVSPGCYQGCEYIQRGCNHLEKGQQCQWVLCIP